MPKLAELSAPTSNLPKKEARTKYVGELRSPQHFSVPSLVMQWPGKGLGRALVQWGKAGGRGQCSSGEVAVTSKERTDKGVGQSWRSGLGQRGEGRLTQPKPQQGLESTIDPMG